MACMMCPCDTSAPVIVFEDALAAEFADGHVVLVLVACARSLLSVEDSILSSAAASYHLCWTRLQSKG